MFYARGGAGLSLRWFEGQIYSWMCCADSMIACFDAFLCVSSGGTCSDAQCPVSACVRLRLAHAEERASGVLEAVAELPRERVRQTMCGHRDAVALKAFSDCLSNYLYSL